MKLARAIYSDAGKKGGLFCGFAVEFLCGFASASAFVLRIVPSWRQVGLGLKFNFYHFPLSTYSICPFHASFCRLSYCFGLLLLGTKYLGFFSMGLDQ
jgi:hypothetical protein